MGGNFIETEASRIYHEGNTDRQRKVALNLYSRGDALTDIANIVEVDIDQVQQWIRNSSSNKL